VSVIEGFHPTGEIRSALGYIMEAGAYASQAVTQFAIQFSGNELRGVFLDGKPLGSQVGSASAIVKRQQVLAKLGLATTNDEMCGASLDVLAALRWLVRFRNAAAHETWNVRVGDEDVSRVVGTRSGATNTCGM